LITGHTRYLSILIGLLSITANLSHAGLLNSGFTATYEVTHKSIYLGDAVQTFKPLSNGNWQYRSDIEAKGFVSMFIKDVVSEVSEIKKTADGYQPLSYRYHQHGGKKEKKHNIIFDWNQGQIHNDNTKQHYPLKANTHDLLSIYKKVKKLYPTLSQTKSGSKPIL